MTHCDDLDARVGDLIDGGLPPEEETAVRAHLETCPTCRSLVADFERVRAAAQSLGPVTPPDHVWLQIAGRLKLEAGPIDAATSTEPTTRATAQWLGIAAALLLITLGLYTADRWIGPGSPVPESNVAAGSAVESVNEELRLALDHYENAIGQLKAMAATSDDALDPAVAAVLDQNLAIIDTAIAESRAALMDDPSSQPARASLFEALSQKVNVLQATAVLINEMRLGNAAGAAEAAAGIGRKSS